MAKVEEKKPIVQEIKDYLDGAKSVVLVDYLGLTVEQDTNLRRATREAGVIYKVYKNTMVNLAIEGTEFADLSKDLEGPTAVAISKDDATAPARIIANFAKQLVSALSQQSLQRTNFFQSSLEVFSHLSRTLLVLSIRLLNRKAQKLK